ncbi:MAG TPA: polysaccharide deacetylase family protein, partial [Deferrisomatales bacterium]|nr:polysaccharide deacetylase family protein [Deferrisomatales bacterium]
MGDRHRFWGALLLGAALGGCAAPVVVREEQPQAPPAAAAPSPAILPSLTATTASGVVARDHGFVIYRVAPGDTFRSLAQRFLGDGDRDWEIEEFGQEASLAPGKEVVIPLVPANPVGVYPDGYQTVPILCYHRFGDKQAKMVVSPKEFAAQMAYLAEHGYRVVPLSAVAEFLAGRRALPRKAVAITMDDGYRSNYQHAYPVLKRHGFPATIFLYTDFLGGGAALRTEEMREMLASGLVDIQPHSKAHTNLALPTAEEDEAAYARRLEQEVVGSAARIRQLLDVPIHTFAYPYGDTDRQVIALLDDAGYRLGATVQA